MTFMDETHSNWEIEARKSARQLILWLQTIAPVSNPVLVYSLWALAEEMKWPKHVDEHGIKTL